MVGFLGSNSDDVLTDANEGNKEGYGDLLSDHAFVNLNS